MKKMISFTAVTTEQETLYVPEHPGTEVTYHWWFGNGDYAITTERSVNYTWPDDGIYNITLLAYNDISFMVEEVTKINTFELLSTHFSLCNAT